MKWDQLANTHMQPVNNFKVLQNPHAHSASWTVRLLPTAGHAVLETQRRTPPHFVIQYRHDHEMLSVCIFDAESNREDSESNH